LVQTIQISEEEKNQPVLNRQQAVTDTNQIVNFEKHFSNFLKSDQFKQTISTVICKIVNSRKR